MTKTMLKSLALCWLLASSTIACGGALPLVGGADVEAVATSVQKPANVAVFLKVTEFDEPVTDLELKNFEVTENEQKLSPEEIGLRLLPRATLANERVVLLIDISGKPRAELRRSMATAVEGFVEKVRTQVPVTVLAYDGSPGLKQVGEYAVAPATSAAPKADALVNMTASDESRDFYGAVILGVKELDVRMMQEKKPLHVGTLVVFSRGPDLAGRTTEWQAEQALENKSYDVIGIGIGEDAPYLEAVAHAGVLLAHKEEVLPVTFEDAAMRVLKTRGMYYILAYCSPGRAGTRAMRVDVSYTNKKNDDQEASYYQEYSAQGFGPGCNSETPPRFVMPRPENEAGPQQPAPAEPVPAPTEATDGDAAAKPDGKAEAKPEGDVAPPPDKPGYK
jgi:hypothetical protein